LLEDTYLTSGDADTIFNWPRVLERRKWVWCHCVENTGNCERELGVVVDCGGPLDQANFAGSGAGIFGADVVRALLCFGGLKGF